MGEEEDKITKFQTGGPDGDLGSNEILISKDLILGRSALGDLVTGAEILTVYLSSRWVRRVPMISVGSLENISWAGNSLQQILVHAAI